MTPSLPLTQVLTYEFFPFATKSVIGIYKKIGGCRLPVSPDSPSCPNHQRETGPENVQKRSVQKFENYGTDFGPPRFGRLAVSPCRLAVSSRRLVSLSRRLAVSPKE